MPGSNGKMEMIVPHYMIKPQVNPNAVPDSNRSSVRRSVPTDAGSESPRISFIRNKFKQIEQNEKVIDSFACAASQKILLQGMLYVTDMNLYFYSPFNDKTLIGKGTKMRISYNSIDCIKKAHNALFFSKSIKVILKHSQQELLFTSFISRKTCYNIIETQRAAFNEAL